MKRAILCATTLLLASGAWGQEKRVTLKAGDCATIHLTQHKDLTICAEKLPAKQEKKAPPFDVKPKEWDGPDTVGSRYEEEFPRSGKCQDIPGFNTLLCAMKIHHRTCADPKRVLLMSDEDKVWHCYLFKEKP